MARSPTIKPLSSNCLNPLATKISRFSTSMQRWLPFLVGGSVLTATLFLWQALMAQERAYIHQETQLEAMSVRNELTTLMESQIQALVRMSKRWEQQGKTPTKKEWEFEAALNVRYFKGFQAIEWVDPSFQVRWIAPLAGNEASQNLSLASEQRQRTALEAARARRDVTVTRSLNLVQGGKGFQVYVPIFQGKTFRGFTIGVFRTQTVLNTILEGEKNFEPAYAIAVLDGAEEIYRLHNSDSRKHEQEWSHETKIDLHGTIWSVRAWPRPELVAELQSPLPSVVLVGGVLTACLLGLAVDLTQRERFRAKQAESANQELENEIAERLRTERLLNVQHATTNVLAETVTLGEAVPKILQAICASLEWQLGEFWSVDRSANVLHRVNKWPTSSLQFPEFEVNNRQIAFPPGVCLPGRIWANGEPVWIADVVQDPNFLRAASAAEAGLHGAFGFPILIGNEILGVILFFNYKIQQPEEDLLQMMVDIGYQIGQFMERKWAEEALQRAHTELEIRIEERTAELSKSNQLLKQKIDERKRAEAQTTASLKEKEVLLKEIHHRVKNNLQVISSLFKLQCRSIQDKQSIVIFQESQNRIESMAFIHELLYQSKDLSQINFGQYISKLTANLFCSYEIGTNSINLNVNVDDVLLNIHAAIPCGLIINELVTNSLKYAFSRSKTGEIYVKSHLDKDSKVVLIVGDDGVGFPEDIDFRDTKSLGLQLVNALTEQLEGTIELNRDMGTQFKIVFGR